LINSRGEFHIVRKTPYHIFPTGGDWGYSEYLMRMVLTTQRKSELLNADQSLKIFTRVIIVGESSSSIIHEEKKNTYESLISLSSHFGSLLSSTKDNCHDVTIIVRPQQYHSLTYETKSHDTPSSSSASSSPIDGGKSSSKKIIILQVLEIVEQNVKDIVQILVEVVVLENHQVKLIMMKQHQRH
jgi:hypothetical protein